MLKKKHNIFKEVFLKFYMKKGVRKKIIVSSIIIVAILFISVLIYNYSNFFEKKGVLFSPDPSLKMYLKFDESSGNVASDSSGNGNTGTIYTASRVAGKFGNAL